MIGMRYELTIEKEGVVLMFNILRKVFDYAVARHLRPVDIYVVTGVGGLKSIDDWIKFDGNVGVYPNKEGRVFEYGDRRFFVHHDSTLDSAYFDSQRYRGLPVSSFGMKIYAGVECIEVKISEI